MTTLRLLAALAAAPAPLAAQAAPAPPRPIRLPWAASPIDLVGPARPGGYVSAIGRRAAALGSETGSFEVWAWPLKLLYGFELAFKTPLYDQPIAGRDVAREVRVGPAGVTIVYSTFGMSVDSMFGSCCWIVNACLPKVRLPPSGS